jgi:type IV pilus assembly protein PilF
LTLPWTTEIGLALTLASTLAFVFALGGCSAPAATGAQSPERQSDAEYDLARDYFFRGDTRIALDHIQKAVTLNGESSKALYFASTIYLWFCSNDRGLAAPDCRMADAEKYARLAVKADPQFRDAKNLLGQVLILEGKYPEAIGVLTPLVNDPAYSSAFLAWGNLGWAQVLSGSIDSGIASLQNAVTQPKFCVGHYRLGVAYEKKGDLSHAESSLTNAVQVDNPDCQNLQDAWEARGRVRVRLGKTADARSDFERCKTISADSPTGKKCLQELTP